MSIHQMTVNPRHMYCKMLVKLIEQLIQNNDQKKIKDASEMVVLEVARKVTNGITGPEGF